MHTRCGGRVVLMDTGMSVDMAGALAAGWICMPGTDTQQQGQQQQQEHQQEQQQEQEEQRQERPPQELEGASGRPGQEGGQQDEGEQLQDGKGQPERRQQSLSEGDNSAEAGARSVVVYADGHMQSV